MCNTILATQAQPMHHVSCVKPSCCCCQFGIMQQPQRTHLHAFNSEPRLLHVELLVVQCLPLRLIHAFLPQYLQCIR